MSRVFGEIAALVFTVLVSCAVLAPAFAVVAAGARPDAEGAGFLVLGMVHGMVAPIGYFLAEDWRRRVCHVLGSALAACGIARTGYLFETRAPGEALLTFAILVAALVAALAWSATVRRRRAKAVAAIEAEATEAVRAVAHHGGATSAHGRAALLAERLAGAAVWTAAREAVDAEDARRRIGRALAALEVDLAANPAIEAAAHAARLVAEMRGRIAPRQFWARRARPLPA